MMWPNNEEQIEVAELIRRLDAAPVPDHYLDKLIGRAIGLAVAWKRADDGIYRCGPANSKSVLGALLPRYTESMDAAITLIPDGAAWAISRGDLEPSGYPKQFRATVMPSLRKSGKDVTAWHNSVPAIALCIAALGSRE